MAQKTMFQHLRSAWVGAIGGILLAVYPTIAIAQIAGDGTLGTQVNGALTAPCTGNCIINGGITRNVNLFHSFKEFSIPTYGQAWFNNAPQIQNILTRITGNSISSIDGLIKTNGSANLFFLNPNGILFGPNARLQIGGSFFASTANSFKFADGSEFSAVNPQAPPLLAINVPIGLQPGTIASSRAIVNQGSLTAGQDLTLNADQLDLQGKLVAGRDLTLQAQDTVRIRESATGPLVVQSGRDLTIQGNQRVDILALNHPQTSIESDRNLSLVSDGIISGDAHFSSGGEVQIRSLSGKLATFASLNDPIISSRGNVDIAAGYTGASLLIESQGNVRIQGTVTINAPDTVSNFVGSDTLLSTQPGLIIRSGQPKLVYGGINQNNLLNSITGTIPSGITLDQPVRVEPNAEGGIVRLSAAQGGVSVARIQTSTNNTNGTSGSIELTALENITTGGLITSNGRGGDITLNSIQGSIKSLGAISQGSSPRSGDIQFFAFGDITTGSLSAISLLGERGGDITLVSRAGSINTSEGNLLTFTVYGPQGGNVTLSAYGNITTTDLITNGRANAGNINLTSQTGSINTTSQPDPLSTQQGFVQAASAFGKGGTITLSASGGIVTANVSSASATGSGDITLTVTRKDGAIQAQNLVSYAEDGDAGNIRLSAIDGDIRTRSLISSGKSRSGDITIRTQGDFTSRSSAILTSTYGDGASGNIVINAGSVSLIAGTQVSTATSNQGAGGNITIVAPDFVRLSGASNDTTIPGLEQKPDGLFAVPDNPLTLPEGTKVSGFIPPASFSLQFGTVTFPSGLYTQTSGVTGDAGRAGNVTLQTSHLVIEDRAAIAATTFGTGSAGNVSIQANHILVNNGGIFSGVGANAWGNSGAIALNTDTLSLTNGGTVQALTLGSGKAGDIQIVAHQAIDLTEGKSDRQNASGILSGSDGVGNSGQGGNILLTTPILSVAGEAQISAATVNSGNGGSILINAPTAVNLLRIRDFSPVLSVETSGAGKAGNILINTPALTLSDKARITATATATATNLEGGGSITLNASNVYLAGIVGVFAETQGQSPAGTLRLNPYQTQPNLRITLTPSSKISASTSGSGKGGNLLLTAPRSIAIAGPGSLAVETSSTGNAGNISINTQQLTLTDGVRLSASTSSSGQAGDISVIAKTVNLNQGAQISTNTASTLGGNIDLNVNDLMVLRRNSSISTNAGTAKAGGDGGNITINAQFVVGVLSENSDITANAFTGKGGNVNITTQGVYGLQFQPQLTPFSDITASSKFGLNGTVTINSLNVDPSRGLAALPINLNDPSQRISQGCNPGSKSTTGKFIATGRGGIPQNPDEPLESRSVMTKWIALPKDTMNPKDLAIPNITLPNSTVKILPPIVEAQHLIRQADGTVELVAHLPSAYPASLLNSSITCRSD